MYKKLADGPLVDIKILAKASIEIFLDNAVIRTDNQIRKTLEERLSLPPKSLLEHKSLFLSLIPNLFSPSAQKDPGDKVVHYEEGHSEVVGGSHQTYQEGDRREENLEMKGSEEGSEEILEDREEIAILPEQEEKTETEVMFEENQAGADKVQVLENKKANKNQEDKGRASNKRDIKKRDDQKEQGKGNEQEKVQGKNGNIEDQMEKRNKVEDKRATEKKNHGKEENVKDGEQKSAKKNKEELKKELIDKKAKQKEKKGEKERIQGDKKGTKGKKVDEADDEEDIWQDVDKKSGGKENTEDEEDIWQDMSKKRDDKTSEKMNKGVEENEEDIWQDKKGNKKGERMKKSTSPKSKKRRGSKREDEGEEEETNGSKIVKRKRSHYKDDTKDNNRGENKDKEDMTENDKDQIKDNTEDYTKNTTKGDTKDDTSDDTSDHGPPKKRQKLDQEQSLLERIDLMKKVLRGCGFKSGVKKEMGPQEQLSRLKEKMERVNIREGMTESEMEKFKVEKGKRKRKPGNSKR